MNESTEFEWNPDEFEELLSATVYDEGVDLSLAHMPDVNVKVLEAGCGSGRVVKYLYDLGYRDIHGIELNAAAVKNINNIYPELQICQGNILDMPYDRETFDVILSYGVVEHFPIGLEVPLGKLNDMLKPGGVAIITVPSYNKIRRIIDKFNLEMFGRSYISHIIKEKRLPKKNSGFQYYVYPKYGNFFEFRLSPDEFVTACTQSGFRIIKSIPISHIDGLYHIFGSLLVSCNNHRFKVSMLGKLINKILKKIPFCHNHMHACVLEKAT